MHTLGRAHERAVHPSCAQYHCSRPDLCSLTEPTKDVIDAKQNGIDTLFQT